MNMDNVAYFHTTHNRSKRIGPTLIEATLMYFLLVWASFRSTLHEDQSNVIDFPPTSQKKKTVFLPAEYKGVANYEAAYDC
jgi:hypothetical protein